MEGAAKWIKLTCRRVVVRPTRKTMSTSNPLSPEAVREVARLAASKWWEHLGPQNTAPDAVADAVAVHLLKAVGCQLWRKTGAVSCAEVANDCSVCAALKEYEK